MTKIVSDCGSEALEDFCQTLFLHNNIFKVIISP